MVEVPVAAELFLSSVVLSAVHQSQLTSELSSMSNYNVISGASGGAVGAAVGAFGGGLAGAGLKLAVHGLSQQVEQQHSIQERASGNGGSSTSDKAAQLQSMMSNYLNTYSLRDNNMLGSYDRPKSPAEELCLSDRRWWAFLLSSIFTFFVGKLALVTRFFLGKSYCSVFFVLAILPMRNLLSRYVDIFLSFVQTKTWNAKSVTSHLKVIFLMRSQALESI